MTAPFYVSPEQVMKDRADYARRNIARGRPVVVAPYAGGIVFIAENPSRALHKVSEIYDRIAFAAVGKYNEFENLRVAGIRYADLRGYSYDRTDVTARGLANAYAQTLGTVFTTEQKPLEVEIVVAEVGHQPQGDQVYRLTYDGSVFDEQGLVVMGGSAAQIAEAIGERWNREMSLAEVLGLVVPALGTDGEGGSRQLDAGQLEVAVLDRKRSRRTFRRLAGHLLEQLLATDDPTTDLPSGDDPGPGPHDTLTGDARPSGAADTDPTAPENATAPTPDNASAPTDSASASTPESTTEPPSQADDQAQPD
ncbi:MAG: proteasome subunit alpha [Actinomycetales bacterium]